MHACRSTLEDPTDTLDLSARQGPQGVGLRGSVSGFFGSTTFRSIDSLVGGASSADSLISVTSGGVWSLGDADSYHNGGDIAFSGFEELRGGDGDTFEIGGQQDVSLSSDGGRFVFADDATVSGSIDGGRGVSGLPSTLDWSAYSTERNVVLTSPGDFHGFDGTEDSIGGGFTNIDVVIGSASSTDSLTGLDSGGTWTPGDPGTYQVGPNILTVLSFERLFGPGLPLGLQSFSAAAVGGGLPTDFAAAAGQGANSSLAAAGSNPPTAAFSPSSQDTTRTTLAASANERDQITLVATVSSKGVPLAQGQVAFYQGAALLAVAPLLGGRAEVTTGSLPIGRYTLTAVFLGDDLHLRSQEVIDLHVQARTEVVLEVSPGRYLSGRAVGFTARASTADGSVPRGRVNFQARSHGVTIDLGAADLRRGGTSHLSATFRTAGPYVVTATFTPASSDLRPSSSNPSTISVHDASPRGPRATRFAGIGGRFRGAGPNPHSATGPASPRTVGSRSTPKLVDRSTRATIVKAAAPTLVPETPARARWRWDRRPIARLLAHLVRVS